MRIPLTLVTILTVIFASSYWLTNVSANCVAPLAYRIGDIDAQFDLTRDQARIALMEAEAVWENATGRNLFSYDDDAAFTVNFIYDERHALTEAERDLRERLDSSENINTAIDATYEELRASYKEVEAEYIRDKEQFEADLATYNETVARYNSEGGAPARVYEELKDEKERLDDRRSDLNAKAEELNALVARINEIGAQGNELVDLHNRHVEIYNETFGNGREFTQGDYSQNSINVYTFADREELILVLAHELGHALGIGHVENAESLMHYLMGGQPTPLTLTDQDLAAFEEMCGVEGYSWFQEWREWFLDWLDAAAGV